MPVPLTCSCGKQLRVPDEMVGRRIKCPACGEAQLVSADSDTPRPTSRKTASPPSAEADDGMVRFRCECGKQMQAHAAHAGKSTRCPACEAVVKIPGGAAEEEDEDQDDRRSRVRADRPERRVRSRRDEDEEEDRPRARRGRAREDEDEDEDEDDWKDRKRGRGSRRKNPVWMWVTAVVVVLLLIGGGIGAWLWLSGPSMGPDLALVPGNAQGFITVRVADVWNHDIIKQALAQAKQQNPQMPDLAAEAENNFGLAPADVERVTVAFGDVKKQLIWAIVYTSKPYDRNKILGKLGSPQERKQGSKTYQVIDKGGEPLALHFHTDRIFLVSNEKGLQHGMSFLDGKHTSGPLDSALKKASGKHHFVGGMTAPPEIAQAKAQMPPTAAAFKPLLDFQSLSIQIDIGKTTSDMEVGASFPNSDSAKAAKKAIDDSLAMLKMTLPALSAQLKQGMGGQGAQVDQMLTKALESLKVNQSGSEVTVSMSSPNGDPGQLAGAFGQLGGLLGGVQKVRGAAGRAKASNDLKQLTLAMHMYADMHGGQLPPAVIYSPAGKPLYSWRVELLPYLEQQALYNQFDRTQPWDSPRNKALLARMPAVFGGTAGGRPGYTPYQVVTGALTPFKPGSRQGPRFPASFTDGSSNTLLIAQGAFEVEWTKPADISMFTGDALKGQLKNEGGRYLFSTADGAIHSVSSTIPSGTLELLVNPADGVALPPNWDK